ncbi:hypothetical protein [Sphingomonas sp. S2-65]|nr:hypothetical protein [Sphingomonas sp. S2-65]UYY60076.1 hypothetical protein LZ586_08360 [Sphingomonas sp. S2-65]
MHDAPKGSIPIGMERRFTARGGHALGKSARAATLSTFEPHGGH